MSNFPTLDGLNNISGDNADLVDITCSTFIATSSAQAPTMVAGNSSNNIATTAFVGDAINTATANLVTTDTSQTLTAGATKFFTSNPQSLTSAPPTLNNEYTNKLYVDTQISTAGGSYVTIGGALQTVTGNKNFTGTTILGDVFSADQPCRVSITNNTTTDSNVNGTISGENVYNQVRFGGRGFYIAQGATDSTNQYFGISGSGAPDADFQLTLRKDVGLKISTGNDTTTFTEQLKVIGTARVTGITTFDVSPVCAVAPTTANQLVPKTYVDTNFVNLSDSQTITGNKTFNVATGTTTIRGNQVDIFPTVTFLTSPTTTISGVNANITSTTSYIGGTTNYLAATNIIVNNTCNSFYIDASYNNFVGKETYINTPYFLINSNCLYFDCRPAETIIRSPYVAFTNACTSLNINATNTITTGNVNMTGSVVTATTQASSDNSTKVATTAFVNSYATSNYMTLTTNQSVSGVKTYSTQQIFNAGLTSNNIYASGTTDMTLGSNMGNGILTIDAGKVICDMFGARIIPVGGNLQLNNGTFIQPNSSLGYGEEPLLNFPNNQVGNFTNFPSGSGQGESTKQINITILKFWCGNNQSSVFTLTHSLTNGYAVGPAAWVEDIVTFTFVDADTGITRYTTPNYATTTAFSMNPFGTVVRPNITFTLDTTILPQAVYNIFAYVKVSNAFINQALNTMTWNLGTLPYVTTQNYNTYADYTFTSRNLYHIFRNTAMCGVFIINNIATQQNVMTPIHYSISDFTNFTYQPSVSGALTTPAVTGGTAVGNFVGLSINNADNIYLVYPNYSLILYDTAGWSGTVYINYKNTTVNPVTVAPTTTQRGSSCRIYFDEVELIKY